MKSLSKILSSVLLLTTLTTSAYGLDNPITIKRTPNTVVMPNSVSPKTDIYLEGPNYNYSYKDGKMVRRRYIKLVGSSLGDLTNAKRVVQLMRGQTHTTTSETTTRTLVTQDYEIKTSTSASFLKIVKAEVSASYKAHFENEVINKVVTGTSYNFSGSEPPTWANLKDVYIGFYKDKYEVVTDIVSKIPSEKRTRVKSSRRVECSICNGGDGGFDPGELSHPGHDVMAMRPGRPVPAHPCSAGVMFTLEDGRTIMRYDSSDMPPMLGRIEGGYYVEDIYVWDYSHPVTVTSYMYVPVPGKLAVYSKK